METVLKVLNELHKNGIDFCLQSRVTNSYYNLTVKDIHGKSHHIQSENINELKDKLIIIWGHLLGSTTTVIKTSTPVSIPLPPMPSPKRLT